MDVFWAKNGEKQGDSIRNTCTQVESHKSSFQSKNCVWLGNGTFWTHGHACIGTHAVGPLQESSIKSLTGRFMLEKRRFWAQSQDFLGNSWDFLRNSWIFLEILGNSKMDPPKSGCEVDFGRRGKLTCHRIDELFKPNCPPGTPQDPRRPPRTPPGLPGGF